jgi:anti-sigma B factor antagonist
VAIQFRIDDEPVDDTTHVVSVTGEIDLFTAPEFKARIASAIEGGARVVVVDLTDTTFIDSSSLGVLIGAHRRLEHAHGRLVVVCENRAILKTFQITGLDHVFTIAASIDEAVAPGVETPR